MIKSMNISKAVNNSMFVLGAGFSYNTGCKMSTEMFNDLKQMVISNDENELTSIQKEAIKFLFSCMQYHSEWRTMESNNKFKFAPNIEELALLIRRVINRENFLPYPITGNWADKLVSMEAEFIREKEFSHDELNENLFESLDRILKKFLKERWLKVETSLNYLEPLLQFFQNTSNENYYLDIFTLNNDMVLEEYFSKNHEIPWRGFIQGKWQDILRDAGNHEYGRLNLYKLHGSIDWVRLEDMDVWEESKLNLRDNKFFIDKIEEKHNPYVIFGQGTKTFSVEPFFSLINHFNIQLKEKDYCFVIGYSFFDPYINNLLFNATMNDKKIIIINPYFGPKEIYQTVNGKFKPKANENDFFRVEYPNGVNKSLLIDYLKDIQKNAFYSELPEFNYSTIGGENIEYIPLTTEDFIGYFFQDKGKLLYELIEYFEKEKESEQPF